MEQQVYLLQIPQTEWEMQKNAIAEMQRNLNRIVSIFDKPLTISETAQRLNISKPTLYKYINEGKIKATRTEKKLLFLQKDIETYLNENQA